MIRKLLISATPLLLCLTAGIAVEALAPRLPLLSLEISAGWLLVLAGLAAGFLTASFFFLHWWHGIRVESAVQAEKQTQVEAQNRFLRRLDHELKNPLTGLRAAVENLEESASENLLPATLPDIRLQVERMVRLTGDLRKLAELEEIPLEQSAVDLGDLLERIVEAAQAQPLGTGRDIRLVVPRVPWPLAPVMADEDLLGSAFFNLIDNALKYSRKSDAVEIRAANHDRQIQVEIADSGPGIATEELPRIFEELYRGANARSSEGSGVGLALVKRIIERHGGTITVHSRMNGATGSIFTVLLPASGAGENMTKR
ncbi:MAG: HAMP domain-containing histidine kinase [Anaerolineales bacterium]|nr:HAMP domain-containing histidine kinase [Anaerolineales bacterium]